MGWFSRHLGARPRSLPSPSLPARGYPRRAILGATLGLALLGSVTTAYADPRAAPYAVQPGDTVATIAAQYGVSVSDLVVDNPGVDLTQLSVGQSLIVPLAPASPFADAPSFAPPTTLTNGAHVPAFAMTPDGRIERTLAPAPTVLPAPYHSQFDGTIWAESNCGPTSLSMALGALGLRVDQISLRELANSAMRTDSPNNGTTWASLAYAASENGATPIGLGNPRKPRSWSLDDLTAQLNAGHPVMLLVRYWDLPDHLTSTYGGDHYIVALGFDAAGNVIINDPATKAGPNRTISGDQLLTAWGDTSEKLVRTAMALSKAD